MIVQSPEPATPPAEAEETMSTGGDGAARPAVTDIEALVWRARAGVPGAMNELVRRFTPLVKAVVRRCGVYGAEAEDIEQETWLRLTTNLGRVREPAALPRWLAVTASRQCCNLFAKRRRVQLRGDFNDEPIMAADRWSDPADGVCHADEVVRLNQAIAELSSRDQTLVRLMLAAASYREISAAISMPVGSIGPTRERVLRKLAAAPQLASMVSPLAGRTLQPAA
ncbi:MAG: RNA polymerase sigma factor [Acidimicrobiales bacterium]